MINSVMSFACDECDGYGYLFFGDNENYDTEPCDCALTPNFTNYKIN
jgi:hypothetical protein